MKQNVILCLFALVFPCIGFSQQVDAPVGIAPCGGDTIESLRPDFNFLSSELSTNQEYSIRLVYKSETQSPEQALAENVEVVYISGITSGQAPFGPIAQSLKPNTAYCWQVVAKKILSLHDNQVAVESKSPPCVFVTAANNEIVCHVQMHSKLPKTSFQLAETTDLTLEPSPLLDQNAIRIEFCLTEGKDTTATYVAKSSRSRLSDPFTFKGPRIGRGTSRSYDARVYASNSSKSQPLGYFRLVVKR